MMSFSEFFARVRRYNENAAVIFDRAEPRMFDPQAPQERMFDPDAPHEPAPHGDFSEPMLEPASGLDDSHSAIPQERRAPPPPIDDDLEFEEEEAEEEARPPRSYRNLIRGAVAALVFIVVGGLLLWQWPNMVALYSSFRAPSVETVRDTPPANTRPKITDRIEPGIQQAPATPAPGALPGAGAAQKVVLYEEDPADPNGKRFVGSAIWRTETVTPCVPRMPYSRGTPAPVYGSRSSSGIPTSS